MFRDCQVNLENSKQRGRCLKFFGRGRELYMGGLENPINHDHQSNAGILKASYDNFINSEPRFHVFVTLTVSPFSLGEGVKG